MIKRLVVKQHTVGRSRTYSTEFVSNEEWENIKALWAVYGQKDRADEGYFFNPIPIKDADGETVGLEIGWIDAEQVLSKPAQEAAILARQREDQFFIATSRYKNGF